jgi:hypothetical protein
MVTQFLSSAIDYYCNVDEIGVRDGCDAERRLRVQGTVEEGSLQSDAGLTTFTISFNGSHRARGLQGAPGGIFQECIPVVVHGRLVGDVFEGDRIEVRTPTSTPRTTTTGSTTLAGSPRMLAAGVTARSAGPGCCSACWPASSGRCHGGGGCPSHDRAPAANRTPLRLDRLAGAVLAFMVMQFAIITRDFSLAYVQQVGSTATPPLFNATAIWSALEGSILLWVLVLAGFTVAIAVAVPQARRRRARRRGRWR